MNTHNAATKNTAIKKSSAHLGDYAALIGIDWADQKHALATLALPLQNQAPPELSTLEHKTDALIEWISSVQERFGGGRIAIAIEQRKGALIHFLSAFDFIDLYPIEPLSLKSYRKALYPSGAQSDPVDAALLVEFLLKHHARLRCHRPHSAQVRQCAQYCEDRRRFVDQRAQALQCLKASLKLYFPLALELFEDLSTSLANAFIRRWPTLEELQRTRSATVRAFFYRHGSRSHKLIERRLERIALARPLTSDPGVIEPQALRVKCLLEQIATLSRMIGSYQQRIQSLVPILDCDGVFASLPGAGTCFIPRLAVLFGQDRPVRPSSVRAWSNMRSLHCASPSGPAPFSICTCPRIPMPTNPPTASYVSSLSNGCASFIAAGRLAPRTTNPNISRACAAPAPRSGTACSKPTLLPLPNYPQTPSHL